MRRRGSPELCTIIECLHEFVDVIDFRSFSQQLNPLLVEGLGLLFDILLLREEEELTLFIERLPCVLVLSR